MDGFTIDVETFKRELRRDGVRCALQVRHAERPKMDPDDPTFGDSLPVTAEGERTARALGEMLGEFRGDVRFVSSPLRRTRMTAELIAEGMGVERPEIPTYEELGNGTFYYDDPAEVLDIFKPGNFFEACFEYFRTGEQKGFNNLYAASDALEAWLRARMSGRLLVATTHDCYIAAFLAANTGMEFTRDNWPRFLDASAFFIYPDGTVAHKLVRTGLSDGICGVPGSVPAP